MACLIVGSLADIEEGIAVSAYIVLCVLDADVLHGNILCGLSDLGSGFCLSGSSGLHIVGIGLGPGSHAALQGVYLGHIVADGGKNVGGSLCVLLTGVADDDKIVIKAVGSSLHGGNAGLEVAFLGSIHVCGNSSRDMACFIVGSLADIKEGIAVSAYIALCVLDADVLHGNVLCGLGDLGSSLSFSGSLGFGSSSGLGSSGGCGSGLSGVSSAGSQSSREKHGSAKNSESFFHKFVPPE